MTKSNKNEAAQARAYAAGRKCAMRCVGSHFYGLGNASPELETAFSRGYADAWTASRTISEIEP